ncbi:putative protein kinase [Aeropyrum pernix]|uniref:non-specific serine/threonine protein kinase n=1 Tax=Aeropyrum pernix TaxID=56636 RepID=A0A401H8S4_AERPX|nr:Kae1-associated kinase Bud32 [Aeropyrum pernix]GBF08783.1 putative protein kinase [Aeropyrum pernix]
MVSLAPWGPAARLEELPLLKRGAEAEIRLGEFMGLRAVFKARVRKPYMHPRLAERLVRLRTRREARVIAAARAAGVSAPALLAVFPSLGLIVMEYVEGPLLKDVIDQRGLGAGGLVEEAGYNLGLLHRAGVVHGDPTTSNYIVRGGGVVLIDYGLAEFSSSVEDRAVDLHLFRRAVESTHAPLAGELYRLYTRGYLRAVGERGGEVLRRAEEIRLRGRYVRERRRSVWGVG